MGIEFRRVAIVGRGLIGGSIELAIEAADAASDVVTIDRGDDLAAIDGADLVILSAPILEIIRILPVLRAHISPGTLVTDTGSTKAAIVSAAGDIRFIGGHPIAGSARGGAAAARADLFRGRSWILTPAPHADPDDVVRLRAIVERLGATVHLLDAEEHDRIFAAVSHLPQLAVTALMHAAGSSAGSDGLALAGPGLRDSTRLAASPPDIWRDILYTNRANITEVINGLIETLEALRDDRSGDRLQATFESAARWKRVLDGRPI